MLHNLDQLNPDSIAGEDFKNQSTLSDANKLVADGIAASDRTEKFMVAESRKVAKGKGKIHAVDYFRYRMYEKDLHEQGEFISDRLNWFLHDICNDEETAKLSEDKVQCTRFLEENNINTIEVNAIINPPAESERRDITHIENADELCEYLSQAQLPVFLKPNGLLGSFGAVRIDACVDGKLETSSGSFEAEQFLTQTLDGLSYLVQPCVTNHRDIAEFSRGLATIRINNFIEDEEPRAAIAVFKICSGDNVADNFWREGNCVAHVDLETGAITRAVSGVGPYQIEHETHPETGSQLLGFQVPYWDEVLDLNMRCSRLFNKLKFQSLDIAVCDDGPVVVEVNAAGSFDLLQIASGKGFLNKENRQFFEGCGVKFKKIKDEDLRYQS